MSNLKNQLKHFMQNEEGVTAIEYGLIAALIAVLIIPNVTLVGEALTTTFGTVNTALR